jgi:hypothetical protein
MKYTTLFPLLTLCVTLQSACTSSPDQTQASAKTPFDEAAETKAIQDVIDGETACFFKGDYECWKMHWSHEPYAFQGWNNSDGTADAAIGWDAIDKQGKDWIETYYKNGEIVIHPEVRKDKPLVTFFNDSLAYLTWKQYNADDKKTLFRTSQETRIMEKKTDGWKIVNVSAFWDTQAEIPFDSLRQ